MELFNFVKINFMVKKYIRKILIKNKYLYGISKILYINLNPVILYRRWMNKKLEDFLDEKLLNFDNIKFIQVGSNDGVQNDPLRKYILQNKSWSGVLIEPVPKIYANLQQLYANDTRVKVLNCAVSDSGTNKLDFFYVHEDALFLGKGLPAWYNQLGSFDKNNIIKHFDGLLEPYIVSESVQVKSLNTIAEEFGSFDFLHIDAEGHDYQVLNSLNLTIYQPRLILMEFKHLTKDQLELMVEKFNKHGYQYKFFSDDIIAFK